MSETSTMPGAAVRLHVADEEDQATAVELNAADEAEPLDVAEADEEDYTVESIMDLEAEDEDPFETLDELLKLEEAELEGRWVKWDALPDAEVEIAHLAAAYDRKGKLERKFREKKGLTYAKVPDGALPRLVEERLWRQAMVGTAIKGWRGKSFEGRLFNERSFLHLMEKSRRFRIFISRHTGTVDDLRKKMREDAEGN